MPPPQIRFFIYAFVEGKIPVRRVLQFLHKATFFICFQKNSPKNGQCHRLQLLRIARALSLSEDKMVWSFFLTLLHTLTHTGDRVTSMFLIENIFSPISNLFHDFIYLGTFRTITLVQSITAMCLNVFFSEKIAQQIYCLSNCSTLK